MRQVLGNFERLQQGLALGCVQTFAGLDELELEYALIELENRDCDDEMACQEEVIQAAYLKLL